MRKRILTSFIIILLASALVSGALAFNFIKISYINNKEEKLLSNISLIENALNESNKYDEEVNFYRLAQDLSSQINSRVTFIKSNGQIIADSLDNSIIFQKANKFPEFQNAMKGNRQIVQRYSKEIGNKTFYLAIPPVKVGSMEVIIRLGDGYEAIDHIIEKFFIYALISTIIGIIFASIIGYISTGKITKPVKELTEASKLIAEGDFNKKVQVNTKDEIEELSISFNQMAYKLKATIDEIKEKNTKMDAILASMRDGLIALDQKNRVILVNNSAINILELDNNIKIGENIGNIIKDNQLLNEIKKAIISKQEYSTEIAIGEDNKIIELSTTVIHRKDNNGDKIGILLIIKDITSIRELERMREDFELMCLMN